MALVTCGACERQVSDTAQECVHCGNPLPASAPAGVAPPVVEAQPVAADDELHPLAIHKLVLLSLCTLGVYELFWFYRNWNRVRERTGRSLSPFWRALFAPIWSYSLFDEVAEQARAAQVHVGWSPMVHALAFFLLGAFWRLPQPWSLLSLFSFLPLIPAQQTINEMAAGRGVRPDATFDGRHIAVVVVGSTFLLLAMIGAFLPPQ
jgi:hypothetical protein